jgi:hypothetical protein
LHLIALICIKYKLRTKKPKILLIFALCQTLLRTVLDKIAKISRERRKSATHGLKYSFTKSADVVQKVQDMTLHSAVTALDSYIMLGSYMVPQVGVFVWVNRHLFIYNIVLYRGHMYI